LVERLYVHAGGSGTVATTVAVAIGRGGGGGRSINWAKSIDGIDETQTADVFDTYRSAGTAIIAIICAIG
jgi:hypothetical protein